MNPRIRTFLRLLLLSGLLWGLTGCSSFRRDWKAARARPVPARSMAGPWEGEWRSEVNGHHGRLRCLISPGTNETWQARFHATYKTLKFIPVTFGYTVPLTVKESDGRYVFHGEEDLGAMAGGVYHYEGEATAREFFSTYRSKYDHGTFDMTRPGEIAPHCE